MASSGIVLGLFSLAVFGYVYVALPDRPSLNEPEVLSEPEPELYTYDHTRIASLEKQVQELETENASLRVTQRLWDSLPENRQEYR